MVMIEFQSSAPSSVFFQPFGPAPRISDVLDTPVVVFYLYLLTYQGFEHWEVARISTVKDNVIVANILRRGVIVKSGV
jgi:hypothetical protein